MPISTDNTPEMLAERVLYPRCLAELARTI